MPRNRKKQDSRPEPARDEEQAASIEDTVKRELPRLRRWLRRRMPACDIEDVIGNALENFLRRPAGSISNMGAYLRTSVANLRVNYFRDKATHRSRMVILSSEDSTTPSPEFTLMEQERVDLLGLALGRLDDRRRLALQLRLQNLSYEEIVARFAELGVRVTVRTLQRYVEDAVEISRQELEIWEEPKKERTDE